MTPFHRLGELLGLLDRRGADEDGLILLVELDDAFGDGGVLLFFGAVNNVRVFLAAHRLVRWDNYDLELVDLLEFGGLGFGGAGHAAELLIKAKVILERDGGERLIFLLDRDAFLGFNRLM